VETPWQPHEYPNTVLMHAKKMHNNARFNFNKFRAMILSKVKTGIMLDADQFLGPAADRLFPRIKEEINEDYPYPILPVHWMSRDNDPKFPSHAYAVYDFTCAGCPVRTQRWGHAHPTFTYHTLPFLARWLRKTLDHELLGQEPLKDKEDEDVLNMGLWAEGATKQWCKFDVPFENMFFKYIRNQKKGVDDFSDPKWYPDGIPLVFYTAHHAVDFRQTQQIMEEFHTGPVLEPSSLMQSFMQDALAVREPSQTTNIRGAIFTEAHFELPPPIYFRGKYFNDGKELKKAYPNLRCII